MSWFDILRLPWAQDVAPLLQAALGHPVAVVLLAAAWAVLVYLGSKIAEATVSHLWTLSSSSSAS